MSAMTTVRGVVAVTDADKATAGCIVWWRLSGTIDAEVLRTEWLAKGLDHNELPDNPGPVTALRRACRTQCKDRVLVRPLGRGEGFAIVNEAVKREDKDTPLDHEIIALVTVNDVGRIDVRSPRKAPTEAEAKAIDRIRTEIRHSYDHHLETLSSKDISVWLVNLMPRLDAVSLRDKGGVYFIPSHNVPRIEAAVSALRAVSEHRVHRVPAMRSEDAVDAILDAVDAEASSEAEGMEKELAAASLGKRGFETRIERCDDTERKVARYEELLGRKLDTLRDRLVALRANLTVAMVKSMPKGEGTSLANL